MSESASYVFLSYASADRECALAVANRLEAAGISVWLDRQAIAGGASWGTEIVDAIENASVVVVCCSAASLASRNVRQELQIAWDAKRQYLPLLLEAVEIPREMRYFLAGYQWVEVLDRSEAEWLPVVLRALQELGVEASPPRTPDFGLVATAPAESPTNLPVPLTRCIGREREVAEIQALLSAHRLVTLTGPGGIGKTRLAIEVAGGMRSAYLEGVWFVALDPLTDPGLVLLTVANTLGIRETSPTPLIDTLSARLAESSMLLVLDNCEQVAAAAGDLGRLLAACPRLRILATSRVPLHVRGETEFGTQPLALPSEGLLDNVSALAGTPVVALFVERAREIRPGFALTAEDTRAVVGICRRLEGLPLAIELAAARVRLLGPRQILQRLDNQLALLTGSAGDRPERQQTMRQTIAWSEELLQAEARVLFRRLSIFAGGFTLEAAEAVAAGGPVRVAAILDLLTGLVEHSLVLAREGHVGEPRYRLLEPIRQYAEARLADDAERSSLGEMHAMYFRALASDIGPKIYSPDNLVARLRLESELANIRAAVTWFEQQASPEQGLRFLTSMNTFFQQMGHIGEARGWYERLLARARPDTVSDAALSNGLFGLGTMLLNQGDYPAAIARVIEALRLFEARGQRRGIGVASVVLGSINLYLGNLALAEEQLTTALEVGREYQARGALTGACEGLGFLALERGDLIEARTQFAQFEEPFHVQSSEDAPDILHFLNRTYLTLVELAEGDLAKAAELIQDANRLRRRLEIGQYGQAETLATLAQYFSAAGQFQWAARLFAAEASSRERAGIAAQPARRRIHDRALETTRAALNAAEFDAEWLAGQAMTEEAAIEHGLEGLPM